jgi:hypothetical protein
VWRVAFRYRAGAWQAVQCWALRKQATLNLVKVERKNPRRKRVILVSACRFEKNEHVSPRVVLELTLRLMAPNEKLRQIREGLM